MKIGWCRLTMLIRIDLNKTTVGFSGMRTGYMRALVEQGHEIKVLSPMDKESIATYDTVHEALDQPEGEPLWDTSWIKGLEYAPDADADDCDLLVVESSACNWMFGCSVTKQPAIRRCAEILDSYKGTVIIEQSDPDLPFPFGKLAEADVPYDAEENCYRNDIKVVENHGWGSPKEIWENKKYCVCVRASSPEALFEDGMACGSRFQYDTLQSEGKINIIAMPQAYDFKNHNVLVEELHGEKQYDLVYTGYPRSGSREKKFWQNFMYHHNCVNRAVCGPWEKNKHVDLKNDLLYHYIDYVGNLSWAELPQFLNKSKFALYIGVSKAYLMDWQTNKPFEAISSGAVLIFDEINYLTEWFGEEFIITESNRDWWSFICKHITDKDQRALWQCQWDMICGMDWNNYLNILQSAMFKLNLSKKKTPLIKKHKPLRFMGERNPGKVKKIFKKYTKMYMEAGEQWADEFNEETGEKMKLFTKIIRETFDKPECFAKEYVEEDQVCIECAFREQCTVAMAEENTESPSSSEEESAPVNTTTPTETLQEDEEEGTITIDRSTSKVVINIRNARDLNLTIQL